MPVSGPLFDGRMDQAIADYADWAAHEVGQQALADWHEYLDSSLQHPTGYYESTLQLTDTTNQSVAHDNGLIYNYWLEGIGRRNAPVTRFEGYHSAERAATQAKASIDELVNPIPATFMSEMGGTP
jgi:hypothetical protein